MYVIATGSRRKDETLFMVDRNRQRASFWSNRLDDAMKYGNRSAADQKAASLKFNRPRVLTLYEAVMISDQQASERDLDAAMGDDEAGWDGHKGYF